ncbi:MAG: hypothetical protein L6R19_18535 [Alphaproteobacteria bacterium]|nr:hypothetical protein [Alphaproteobacteria bacterium]
MRILGDARRAQSALPLIAVTMLASACVYPSSARATDLTQRVVARPAGSPGAAAGLDVQEVANEESVEPMRRDRLFNGNKYKIEAKINPAFSVNSSLRFERPSTVQDGQATENSSVFLEQMFVSYDWENTAGLRLGKYDNQRFGLARPGNRDVGVFGADSPLDAYDTRRVLGVNPYLRLGGNGWTGSTRVDASVFRLDDSAFAGSWTDYREPVAAADAAPAPPPSLALAVSGSDPFHLRGLGYHLGYQQVARGAAESDRQYGFAAGLSYGATLGDSRMRTTAEIGYLRHQDGLHDGDLQPGMALQGTIDDSWRAFANYGATRRPAEDPDAGDFAQDRSYGAGIGYSFDSGPNLDLAWNRKVEHQTAQDQPAAQDSVGVRVHYGLKF